jgi:flagellar P-ring protein FlgI
MRALILFLAFTQFSYAATRLKDIISIKGVRQNPLIGYGLVIGLNGTGDGGGEITINSLRRMFQKLGLNPQREVSAKNVAAVIVTAKMPPFARLGQKMDVTVSSIGDASSIAGGTLLVTPMKGGDGHVYAIAQGPVSIGGLKQGMKFPTAGNIIDGAIIEKELELNFHDKKSLRLSLNNADFTTAARVEKILNQELGGKYATAKDSATIDLIVPTLYQRKIIHLVSLLENFQVTTDSISRIIINEKTGTIIAGGDIKVDDVAISHNDLTLQVGGGEENAGKKSLFHMKKTTTLNDLVKSLNSLGVAPDDLINIFKGLKQNGAINAQLEFK